MKPIRTTLLALALACALPGCAGLDVAWELHATYLTDELLKKRAAADFQRQLTDGTAAARQVEADRAAAALIAARNEAATK